MFRIRWLILCTENSEIPLKIKTTIYIPIIYSQPIKGNYLKIYLNIVFIKYSASFLSDSYKVGQSSNTQLPMVCVSRIQIFKANYRARVRKTVRVRKREEERSFPT